MERSRGEEVEGKRRKGGEGRNEEKEMERSRVVIKRQGEE